MVQTLTTRARERTARERRTPSGTATTLAEILADVRKDQLKDVIRHGREAPPPFGDRLLPQAGNEDRKEEPSERQMDERQGHRESDGEGAAPG